MDRRRKQCRGKGVSPVIATLMLIIIAVAASAAVYSFMAGFIQSTTQPIGTLPESIAIEAVQANTNTNSITVYVRNTGQKTATVSAAYLEKDGSVYLNNSWSLNLQIHQGSVANFTVQSHQLTPGAYQIKVVCTNGGQASRTIVVS